MVKAAKGAKNAKLAKKDQVLFVLFGIFVSFVVQSGSSVNAQLPPARLSFEVASVKPSPDPRSVPVFTPVIAEIQPGGVWRSTFATVFGLISF